MDSARVRFLRWTLSSKWNKEVMISSAGLNQKPSDMKYRASIIIANLRCMICWSGKRLDCSMWLIRSILGGSYLWKRINPVVVSQDNKLTISRGEGWGHSL